MSIPLALMIALLALCTTGSAQTDAAAIIQRSVEANRRDWAAAPHYDYREQDKSKDGAKTFQELMIEGSRYERLISINGKPLSPDMEARERRKLNAEIVRRKNESPDQRRRRIARYEADRRRDHLLM